MRDIWVPDFVYKYLPLFCIIVGFAFAPFVQLFAISLCAGLIGYGIAVYSMRHSWRNSNA